MNFKHPSLNFLFETEDFIKFFHFFFHYSLTRPTLGPSVVSLCVGWECFSLLKSATKNLRIFGMKCDISLCLQIPSRFPLHTPSRMKSKMVSVAKVIYSPPFMIPSLLWFWSFKPKIGGIALARNRKLQDFLTDPTLPKSLGIFQWHLGLAF